MHVFDGLGMPRFERKKYKEKIRGVSVVLQRNYELGASFRTPHYVLDFGVSRGGKSRPRDVTFSGGGIFWREDQ
jgi:hypothetical protein